MKYTEYIYFDDENNVDYSTREQDRYNNNQMCIRLQFDTKIDRTIVLNALFGKRKQTNIQQQLHTAEIDLKRLQYMNGDKECQDDILKLKGRIELLKEILKGETNNEMDK